MREELKNALCVIAFKRIDFNGKINVKEVCKEAGVGRSSFYREFGSEDRFYCFICERMLKLTIDMLPSYEEKNSLEEHIKGCLRALFSFAPREKKYFYNIKRFFHDNCHGEEFIRIGERIFPDQCFARVCDEEDYSQIRLFLISGIVSLVCRGIFEGTSSEKKRTELCEMGVEFVVNLVI